MPFAFLAPLALAAAALVGVPWYLHHIRRPEREPVPFSSLMFVPDVKREVIERRRLQHLLLMLLRMFVFLLLAYAFARPYVPLLAAAGAKDGFARHVVLLDTSYSMGAVGNFDAAKAAARGVVDALPPEAEVALIAFAGGARVLAPFGGKQEMRLAIEGAALTHESTDYEAALRRAEKLLGETGEESGKKVVHLVSDFQQSGMPRAITGWKLPAAILFDPIEVGKAAGHWSVQDVDLRESGGGRLQVRAKVKNWYPDEQRPVAVRLVSGGEVLATEEVTVTPGNATLVTLECAKPESGILEGWVEAEDAGLASGNRRYFTWNPERPQHVLLVADTPEEERWPSAALLEQALGASADSPWNVTRADLTVPLDFENVVIAIVAGEKALSSHGQEALDYAAAGGRVLFALGETPADDALNALLAPLALRTTGARFVEAVPSQFALLSWIDFQHPVFHPFQGARYNDFSDIRFYNYRLLETVPGGAGAPRVAARFEPGEDGAEHPAVIDVAHGNGRVTVWAFPIDFGWTNLPKTARFVPLLEETLAGLAPPPDLHRAWTVGEKPAPPREGAQGECAVPGDENAAKPLGAAYLDEPGFLRWTEPDTSGVIQSEAINVAAAEADPARLTSAEFALRMTSAPVVTEAPPEGGGEVISGEAPKSAWEFGRYLLAAVLAALLAETWYASRLK